jgi:hypothetical protein
MNTNHTTRIAQHLKISSPLHFAVLHSVPLRSVLSIMLFILLSLVAFYFAALRSALLSGSRFTAFHSAFRHPALHSTFPFVALHSTFLSDSYFAAFHSAALHFDAQKSAFPFAPLLSASVEFAFLF